MGSLFRRPRSPYWYADFLAADGSRKRRCTKLRDKAKALKKLSEWEVAAANLSEISLTTAIDDYINSLKASGRSSQHITRTQQLINAVVSHNKWVTLGQVSGAGVERYAATMKSSKQAARTINSMLTAIRSFCRWCVLRKYMTSDPTSGISKPSVKRDRRIERRALSIAEWQTLREYLVNSEEVKNGLDGPTRLLLYWLAVETGLRSGELRSLKCSACNLVTDQPHVLVKASLTKDGELAKQYVSDSLASRLGQHVTGLAMGDEVFPVVSRHEMARVLRDDCDDARRLYKGDDMDFLASPNSQKEKLSTSTVCGTPAGRGACQRGLISQRFKSLCGIQRLS